MLVLHGGPGASHEYLLDLEKPLTEAGYELYFYDQLGSAFSDQPEMPRSGRSTGSSTRSSRCAPPSASGRTTSSSTGSPGRSSRIEYAIAYQSALKGVVLSNMMASIPAYNVYAETVLMPAMDQDALAEIKRMEAEGETEDPRYEELLIEHHYVHHVLRRPPEEWPEHVPELRGDQQGHLRPDPGSERAGRRGKLVEWDRFDDLHRIEVPTLVMGAEHDTMDPAYLRAEWPSSCRAAVTTTARRAAISPWWMTPTSTPPAWSAGCATSRRGASVTDAILVLEDDRTFSGESYGAAGETFGEAVFNTGMTGYQETLTDPSYHRQVVVMTAPHIGNTG